MRSPEPMGLDALGMRSSQLFWGRTMDDSLTVGRHPGMNLVQYQTFREDTIRILKQEN
jgi:hypothetical protein